MKENNRAWAVVVAAGRGQRFGQPYNKVFHLLDGRSILSRCLDALKKSDAFEGAVLVLSPGDEAAYRALTEREGENPLVKRVVSGGDTRQASVLRGLEALPEAADLVAVHDAARPFVAPELVRALVEAAERDGAAIPGRAVTDTIKRMDEAGYAVETPDRSSLCAVQTPQAFRRDSLLQAHLRAVQEGVQATDDAALYEKYVGKVRVIVRPECEDNIKVTTPRDLGQHSPAPPRVGLGYDAHRLAEGRDLVLCGVKVPWEKGLLGHSDADVATHALMDALLGAAGLGDIGRHFPDSDEAYRGISSMELLRRVMDKLEDMGLAPVSADVTIVAQRPKLKDYMDAMKENLRRALALPMDRVNVKATTTEGMGFEGEGLGISAQAVAMLLPREDSRHPAV